MTWKILEVFWNAWLDWAVKQCHQKATHISLNSYFPVSFIPASALQIQYQDGHKQQQVHFFSLFKNTKESFFSFSEVFIRNLKLNIIGFACVTHENCSTLPALCGHRAPPKMNLVWFKYTALEILKEVLS